MPSSESASVTKRQLLERYKHVRDDHLRYMQKWGFIRPSHREAGDTVFSFADVSIVRQADEALGGGATFRAVLRNLAASRNGQLTLDFRIDAQHAKVLQLKRREPPPMAALMDPPPLAEDSTADQYFAAASILDDGNPENFDEASTAYRRALEIDPYLVPALINLANIHY